MAKGPKARGSAAKGRTAEAHFATAQRRIEAAKASGAAELDLSGLRELAALPREIAGLTALQSLDLGGTRIGDLALLAGLTALQSLDLEGTQVGDLAPLAGLTALQSLVLRDTPVGNLAPLASLTALQSLVLGGTQVGDLAPLAGLTVLQRLDLAGTPVGDLAPLAGLTALQRLDLDSTQVGDLAPLAGLTAIQHLDITGTQVGDLAPLAGLTALQSLGLGGTWVGDLAPLASLSALQRLDLRNSRVNALAPLARLTGLQDAAVADTKLIAAGLFYESSSVSRSERFQRLARLPQPACTVETINAVRRQRGLPEHVPERYRRPDGLDYEPRRNTPTVPKSVAAAIEPVLDDNFIRLPSTSAAADGGRDTLEAALSALKAELSQFRSDLASEGNIDKRATAYFALLAERVPASAPSQEALFALGHAQDVLNGYAQTVNAEWPPFLAARYHAVNLKFDRVLRQFPKWREFKRNAEQDTLTPAQMAEAGPISKVAARALADADARPFLDQRIPEALTELAAPLTRDATSAQPFDPVEAGKELLIEDIVESINNILKPIAEAALAAGATATEVAKEYGRALAKGVVDAAKKQGPKDGAAIVKWARRLLLSGGGAAGASAFIQRLIQTYPEKFAWLEAIIKFISP